MTEYGRIHTDGSRSGGQPVLEPCPVPWCGSSDVKARSFDANHRRHWIECGKCNFKTPQMPSRTKVITLWNTRQPTQSDALQADIDAMKSILWVDTIIDDQEAIGKAFARHRQYGYDQGYYDGQRDRPPTRSDALQAENEQLRHDLERQMTIANEQVNEAERLRDALEAAPIISLWESKEDFRRRQDGWLKTKYRAALEQSK